MARNDDGELLNDQDLDRLETDMAGLEQEKEQCVRHIQTFREQEDPQAGIFYAQKIHAQQQEKLRLQVEIDLCRARKNRYLLAREWGEV
ncbi:MAG: hypothetical protein R6V55_09420 [Desulfovermiculus sp.]